MTEIKSVELAQEAHSAEDEAERAGPALVAETGCRSREEDLDRA
ncbi:hypothetical protein AB0A63_05155 [Lentzea sp. NPDC042327]